MIAVQRTHRYLGALLRALHPLPTDEIARTLPLRPLDAPDLKAALEGPARAGLQTAYTPFAFEAGLSDRIVNDDVRLRDVSGGARNRKERDRSKLWTGNSLRRRSVGATKCFVR